MAASDPTPYVATPTGVLQGVAAFSWDGSAWTPGGRAGPGVATPTGVLQGVAPFAWDGAGWQPVGRAGPGVATPTGTLDGVAVYTWSGSAWTPAYGGTGCRTPTGTLRGVAAFNWDGAAWQPASQARASVATPYGVLDGVAMFNWTGSAWAAVQGPSLDIVFSGPTLDPRITFTRAGTATYFNSSGVMQTAAINEPRFDYVPMTLQFRGLLIEEARTNVLLNSATLGTQSVAVTAQAYMLSFYGTGTITKSGTATGALVGVGAFPQRVTQTFTPTAGTLTLTVTGSVLSAQLEAGTWATSYIPTTSVAVTRANEACSMPVASWYDQTKGSWALDYMVEGALVGYSAPAAFVGANINADFINVDQFTAGGSTATIPRLGTAAVSAAGTGFVCDFSPGNVPIPAGAVSKGALAWANGQTANGAHNGVGSVSPSPTITSMPVITSLTIGGEMGYQYQASLWVRRVRYWPRVLSSAELQSVTV